MPVKGEREDTALEQRWHVPPLEMRRNPGQETHPLEGLSLVGEDAATPARPFGVVEPLEPFLACDVGGAKSAAKRAAASGCGGGGRSSAPVKKRYALVM